MKLNRTFKKIMFIILFSLVFIWFFGYAKELNFEEYLIQLKDNLQLQDNEVSTKDVIQKYCNSVLKNTLKYEDIYKYKANESAFVYILCTNIDNSFKESFVTIKEYFTWTSFQKLGIKQLSSNKKINYCSPVLSNLNNCNIPKQFSKIFKIIINDYINIKQSSMYGITKKIDNSDDIEKLANNFWNKHFFIEICNSKKTWITYSKSCNIVKSYIQSASAMIKNLKIIDNEKIYKQNDNMIYNWIIKESETTFIDLTNLLYNELFFFHLFLDYYNKTLPSYENSIVWENKLDTNEQKINFNNEFDWIEKSISMTIRNLRDLYISFPIHIWLVMYYEDVLKLWKELQWISNPIYNLYDKLRNVQEPSK